MWYSIKKVKNTNLWNWQVWRPRARNRRDSSCSVCRNISSRCYPVASCPTCNLQQKEGYIPQWISLWKNVISNDSSRDTPYLYATKNILFSQYIFLKYIWVSEILSTQGVLQGVACKSILKKKMLQYITLYIHDVITPSISLFLLFFLGGMVLTEWLECVA